MTSHRSLTLLVTQPDLANSMPERWDTLETCHIFFVHRGVGLVDQDWSGLPSGQRVYCMVDHEKYRGPPPHATNHAGGLATLGRLVHESEGVWSLPHGREPLEHRRPVIGLSMLLDRQPELAREGLRIAVGLAGCDVPVTLFAETPRPWRTLQDLGHLQPDAKEFIDILIALGMFQDDSFIPDAPPVNRMGMLQL
ncbi:MAG: hypothetical protein HQL81_14405 [Magnetococcales bacterium]|nr:hypothetical protein [Magnetococcales bacterium]